MLRKDEFKFQYSILFTQDMPNHNIKTRHLQMKKLQTEERNEGERRKRGEKDRERRVRQVETKAGGLVEEEVFHSEKQKKSFKLRELFMKI